MLGWDEGIGVEVCGLSLYIPFQAFCRERSINGRGVKMAGAIGCVNQEVWVFPLRLRLSLLYD